MEDTFENRLKLWAARKLQVTPEEITKVDTDWGRLCDTCEYSWGEIKITLADGRRFKGEDRFGLFLEDMINLDLNPDGTLSRYADSEPFKLKAVT